MTADPPDDATNDDIVDGARPDADALTVPTPFGTEVPEPEPAVPIDFGTPADDAGSHPGNNRAPEHEPFPDEPSAPETDTADTEATEAARPAATYRIAAWATGAGGLLHTRFVRPVDQRYRTVARVGVMVLAAAVVLWILVFARLLVDRHNRFGTYAFDLGVYDQSVWLLSRFKDPFITVRGLNQWGFHANFMLYIFVPFYWLGAGPNLLNIAFALSLGLGAYPVYRIGRHYFANPVYGVVFALLYLANPTLQFMTWESFHPDGMAILPMLFAWLYFLERRWRLFAVACAVAVLWKEDVALATAALGLFMVLFAKDHRLKGVATISLSALYFQFINNVFLGHFTGDGAFYNDWFGELGSSPTEIAGNMIRHPDMVFSKFRERSASEYVWKLLTPFGWLPVLSIGAAFIAVPQLLVNVLANQTFFRDYRYHYASIILVGLTIASQNTVRLVGRLGNGRRWLCMGILVVCGVRTAQLWGVGPLTENYDAGFWPKQAGVADDARREALEMVPDDASLSATYNLLVHSTQRVGAYDYPSPFIPRNWGLAGENVHDPATVDYLLVERSLLGDTTELFDSLTARGGQFEVVFDRDNVVLSERVRAPRRGEVLPGTPESMTQALPSTTSAEG